MYIVRISDTYCSVYNEQTGEDVYQYFYREGRSSDTTPDQYQDSLEALKQAERQCEKMNTVG